MTASLKNMVLCMIGLGLALAANNYASAQLFRGRRVEPVQPVPTQPVQQPMVAPVNPATPGNVTPAPTLPTPGTPAAQPMAQGAMEGKFIRGRSLIGMNIWGPNQQQQLGTVQDFIVDDQGECPNIFFAVSPQIAGWSGDYVVVPFNALQPGFDQRQRTHYFTMNMGLDAFGRAPHLAVDKWNSGQDRQFFTNSQQFFHRTEHTAARPESGEREQRPELPQNQRPGEHLQPGTQPSQPTPTMPQPPTTGRENPSRTEQPATGRENPGRTEQPAGNSGNSGNARPSNENSGKSSTESSGRPSTNNAERTPAHNEENAPKEGEHPQRR